jgi:hypothetical protein
MDFIGPLLVIIGALVALSGLIISRKPDLETTFDKISPYAGFVGVALLGWGLYDLYRGVFATYALGTSRFGIIKDAGDTVAAYVLLGHILLEIVLGFMLGFGLIASWIPGESGAEKGAVKIQKKLLAYSVPLGFVGLGLAVFWLILRPDMAEAVMLAAGTL